MWGHQLVWMGWQSIQIVGASACVIFILLQKIQKMMKCTFWYWLTRVVLDKVERVVKWLCVCVCSLRTLCRALRQASRNIYGRSDRSIYEVLFLNYCMLLLVDVVSNLCHIQQQ